MQRDFEPRFKILCNIQNARLKILWLQNIESPSPMGIGNWREGGGSIYHSHSILKPVSNRMKTEEGSIHFEPPLP